MRPIPGGQDVGRLVRLCRLRLQALLERGQVAWHLLAGLWAHGEGHEKLSDPVAFEVDRDRHPGAVCGVERIDRHIYDRGEDGTQCRWARVLAYEPPNRVVFSWDINGHWQIETDPDKTSEVEVRFIAESDDRTRVELEHRNLERHGEGWEAVRDGVGHDAGWPLYLQRYADAVDSEQR